MRVYFSYLQPLLGQNHILFYLLIPLTTDVPPVDCFVTEKCKQKEKLVKYCMPELSRSLKDWGGLEPPSTVVRKDNGIEGKTVVEGRVDLNCSPYLFVQGKPRKLHGARESHMGCVNHSHMFVWCKPNAIHRLEGPHHLIGIHLFGECVVYSEIKDYLVTNEQRIRHTTGKNE